jgi:hypothetical protein
MFSTAVKEPYFLVTERNFTPTACDANSSCKRWSLGAASTSDVKSDVETDEFIGGVIKVEDLANAAGLSAMITHYFSPTKCDDKYITFFALEAGLSRSLNKNFAQIVLLTTFIFMIQQKTHESSQH